MLVQSMIFSKSINSPHSNAERPPSSDQEALLKSLAELHKNCLPRSALSVLSVSRLAVFYQRVAQSERDFVYLLTSDRDVIAGCALFANVSVALHAYLGFEDKVRILFSELSVRSLIKKLMQPTGDTFRSDLELAYMFTSPEKRGMGLGSQLISMAMGSINKLLPGKVVIVATEKTSRNRAIGFYLNNNFQRLGTRQQGDKEMLVMKCKQGFN